MTSIAFDTLKFARTLRDRAKMSPEQAEGLSDALLEAIQGDIPTKADLKDVEASIEGVKASIEALRTSTRSDMDAVKASQRETELRLEARIESTKSDIIKWVAGLIGFQTLAIIGAVIALARILKP
ncbi:hypothetical protein NS228_11970 [Methylobacterium indicum]|uniref:DUF1640 domain-containing protein n=1 Tax=Methylobacterium indicum TaxID=1775910 RepID=A0A0J6QZC6_9HYPH|nr:hypothetical protein [Methylobacterium indicum]KMO14304.1 hypothetical protein QR78_23620 [Methylobacterium indicum]KMO16478.1 hypothetical protein QR79_22985 [Methylobacterium indicum]KTS29290.1 hypothetical protein NS229_16845 [Methylobacterium indicum]KTS40230.1 hypothetical protein NS228_11970 [Methylobacterium indicum]KTS45611.1 hypothetical protein NS230_23580 [Methylobacterium indicum]